MIRLRRANSYPPVEISTKKNILLNRLIRSGSDSSTLRLEQLPRPSLSTLQEAVEDPDLVTWDGENDPKNPKNWSIGSKWAVCPLRPYVTIFDL
jgi:hypothetical protein